MFILYIGTPTPYTRIQRNTATCLLCIEHLQSYNVSEAKVCRCRNVAIIGGTSIIMHLVKSEVFYLNTSRIIRQRRLPPRRLRIINPLQPC